MFNDWNDCSALNHSGRDTYPVLLKSQPYLGNVHQLETVAEYKVEMICGDAAIKAAVQTLLSVHPYEEPAYEVYKILTIDDL